MADQAQRITQQSDMPLPTQRISSPLSMALLTVKVSVMRLGISSAQGRYLTVRHILGQRGLSP